MMETTQFACTYLYLAGRERFKISTIFVHHYDKYETMVFDCSMHGHTTLREYPRLASRMAALDQHYIAVSEFVSTLS